MSKRFNIIVISIILIAMVGLPVFSAIQAALQGSGSTERQMDKGIELYQDRLPIEMDQYITLTRIDREERQLIYDYEVKVEREKLLNMRDYFQRKSQFNYCHSDDFLTFQTQNITTVERFRSVSGPDYVFQVEATNKPCKSVKRTTGGYIKTIDTNTQRALDVEYLSFFLPIEVSETMSIVSLIPPPHGIVEHRSSGGVLVGMADSVGAEILVEFCEENDNSRYKIYVKPSDKNDPIFSFNISAEICRSGIPEYSFLTESDVRSLEVMRELMISK